MTDYDDWVPKILYFKVCCKLVIAFAHLRQFFGGSILSALLTIFQSLRLSNSTMAKKQKKNPFLHGNSKTEIPDFG